MPPRRNRLRLWVSAVLLALYAAFVLIVTMWPIPIDTGYDGAIERLLAVLHRNGIPEWFGYDKLEFTANVLMFVPIGFFFALILPTRIVWVAAIAVPGFSVLIECIQAVFLPGRFGTPMDVLSNSIGGCLGAVCAVVIRLLVHERDRSVVARALWDRGIRD